MLERFTDRARKVMSLANREALLHKQEFLCTEHVLLALALEGTGVAAFALKNLADIDYEKLKAKVYALVRPSPGNEDMKMMGKLPYSPKVKTFLDNCIEEARNLNHNYIGTEHLLLGLTREDDGVAAHVLNELGVTLEKTREAVMNLLGNPGDKISLTRKGQIRALFKNDYFLNKGVVSVLDTLRRIVQGDHATETDYELAEVVSRIITRP